MFARVLLVAAVAASLASAQQRSGRSTGNVNNPRVNDPFGTGNNKNTQQRQQQREVRTKSKFEELATSLKLDKDQKKAVRTAFDQTSKEAEPLRQRLQKTNHEIFEAVKDGKGEAEVGELVQKQSSLYAEMAGVEMRAFTRMFKELDPNQYKKAEELMPRLSGFFNTKQWSKAE